MTVTPSTTRATSTTEASTTSEPAVADRLAEILAATATAKRRAGAMDAIIAATALAHDLAVWTQDDDFTVLAELAPGLHVHRG